MYLGEVIKKYREEHGISQQSFSDKSSLSKPYISQLENNRNPKTGEPMIPSSDTFVKVAQAMGMSLSDLLSLVDENQPVSIKTISDTATQPAPATVPTNISTPAAYPLPILGTICAGDGVICDESFEGMFFVDNTIRANYCLHVHGDSMIDAEIYDGDIVFILKDYIYEDGKIYAVVIKDENEAVLKRLYLENDKLILSPCNSDYRPVFADPEDVFIVGECVGVYRAV